MLLLLSLTNLSIYVWISKAFEQSSKLSNPDLTKILFPLNQQIIPTKLKDNSHQKTLPTKRLFPPKDKGLQLCDFSSTLAPLLSPAHSPVGCYQPNSTSFFCQKIVKHKSQEYRLYPCSVLIERFLLDKPQNSCFCVGCNMKSRTDVQI